MTKRTVGDLAKAVNYALHTGAKERARVAFELLELKVKRMRAGHQKDMWINVVDAKREQLEAM